MNDDVRGGASGGRNMNNPMQAEGAVWGWEKNKNNKNKKI
jgi:hypothetical protein